VSADLWPSESHDEHTGCSYLALRLPNDTGLFCTKCGWGWSAVEAELAALKARRCDGCVWAKPLDASSLWVRGGDDMRRCDVQTQVEAPMLSDCTPRTAKWQEIVVRADHACNAWMAKEPTT